MNNIDELSKYVISSKDIRKKKIKKMLVFLILLSLVSIFTYYVFIYHKPVSKTKGETNSQILNKLYSLKNQTSSVNTKNINSTQQNLQKIQKQYPAEYQQYQNQIKNLQQQAQQEKQQYQSEIKNSNQQYQSELKNLNQTYQSSLNSSIPVIKNSNPVNFSNLSCSGTINNMVPFTYYNLYCGNNSIIFTADKMGGIYDLSGDISGSGLISGSFTYYNAMYKSYSINFTTDKIGGSIYYSGSLTGTVGIIGGNYNIINLTLDL